ncbi:hypothetical protein KS4_00210 [Poriferisphaera corsica]|uniref:STAS/SEC14 domain-containing protein n=1 Tax=Poriferisphaera corsica TaxID=2528020 RepID=A0A517YP52_9BACT|nr:STAS/SEC14 domain-containing protein [Poriferisphaera corsica]QDU31993.1 hypothetical protein KS4_00210 [Poriferisphaera corsica]
MIDPIQRDGVDNAIGFSIDGKLHADDYRRIIPICEQLIEDTGELRILVYLKHYEGASFAALFQDLKFDVSHWSKFKRIAMVGDKKWQAHMAKLTDLIMHGEVKHFTSDEMDEAWVWVSS